MAPLNYSYMVLLSEIDQLQAEIGVYKEAIKTLAAEIRRMNEEPKPIIFGVVPGIGGKTPAPKEDQVRPANGR
jgi:hypothetical protein